MTKPHRTALHKRAQEEDGLLPQPVEAYDSEADEMMLFSGAEVARAQEFDHAESITRAARCVILWHIKNERLYLALGYSSFRDYTHKKQYSYKTARRYAEIGERYSAWMKELPEERTITQVIQLISENEKIQRVESLGPTKQRLLLKEDNDLLEEIAETGTLTARDGSGAEIALEDLVALKTEDLRERLEEKDNVIEAYRRRLHQSEEDKKLLQSQIESDEQAVARAEASLARAHDLEAKYAERERSYDEKFKQLTKAREAAGKLRQAFLGYGLEVGSEDPDALKALVADTMDELVSIMQTARAVYWFALLHAPETTTPGGWHGTEAGGAIDAPMPSGASGGDGAPKRAGGYDPDRIIDPHSEAADVWREVYEEIGEEAAYAAAYAFMDEQEAAEETEDHTLSLGADGGARADVLRERGWSVEPTLDGEVVLAHARRGLSTRPAPTLDAAMDAAEAMDDAKVRGLVGRRDGGDE